MPFLTAEVASSKFGRISVVIGLFVLMVLGTSFIRWRLSQLHSLPYPPGPKPRPFIGNAHDIPATKPWITYTNWAKQYGRVIHLRDYSEHIIIVNSLKDAINLLEKRSKLYSDRPIPTMVKLMGWDFVLAFMRYGNDWRRRRRIFQQTFKRDASLNYHPIQTRKIHQMLQNLLETPEDFTMHYKTVAAAIVMSAMYGHDISPTNDYFVLLSEAAMAKLDLSVFPGATLVNTFPMLRHIPSWFPGAHFKRFAKETRALTNDMRNVPFEMVKKKISQGVTTASILAELLERHNARRGSKQDEEDIKAVTATSYAAGADTTASATGTFFYAMACHPHAQQKAQQEIDNVIGCQRLPNLDDRPTLPYVEALYREVMRWRPVLPLSIAHSTTDDDVYEGYFIPKGATVYGNVWAMAHDESVYTNPAAFLPERFINDDGGLNNDDLILAFGFGRRICPGRHMASATVWLTIATVLSTFDIRKAKDEMGQEIPIPGEYTEGLISHPLPFRCSITPRSEEAVRLIQETKYNLQ